VHRAERVALALLLMLVAGCDGGFDAAPAGFASGRLPRLEAGAQRVVLSWVEGDSDAARLMFAVLGDGAPPTPVQAALGSGWMLNWADVPGVTPLEGDAVVAHWYTAGPGGGHAYDLWLSWSDDGGATWSEPHSPHPSKLSGEHGFATAFTGSAPGFVWLDGREVGSGGATALRAATRDAQTDTLVDDRVCDCCQTDFAATDEGGVLVYRDRSDGEIRDVVARVLLRDRWLEPVAVGADGWQVAGCPVNGPAVAAASKRVAVVWPTGAGGRMRVQMAWSFDGGRDFSDPIVIDAEDPVGRVDITLTDGGDALVSWLGRPNYGRSQLNLMRVRGDGTTGPVTTVGMVGEGRAVGFPQLAQGAGTVWVAWAADDGLRLTRYTASKL
jgi:hypothetical protein